MAGVQEGQEAAPHAYEFADFRLNTLDETLIRISTGQLVTIKPMAFRLLCVLVENRERELDNDELFGHLAGRRH